MQLQDFIYLSMSCLGDTLAYREAQLDDDTVSERQKNDEQPLTGAAKERHCQIEQEAQQN